MRSRAINRSRSRKDQLHRLAGRCAVRQDQNENIVPTKKDSTGRNDGIVASIIGLSRALDDGGRSIYETQGLLVL
jgi:phage terminase large subunit-like protein